MRFYFSKGKNIKRNPRERLFENLSPLMSSKQTIPLHFLINKYSIKKNKHQNICIYICSLCILKSFIEL